MERCRGTQEGNGDRSGDGNESGSKKGNDDEDGNMDGNEDRIKEGGGEGKHRIKLHKSCRAIRHFHSAHVIISTDSRRRLRAPDIYARKARCLYTPSHGGDKCVRGTG